MEEFFSQPLLFWEPCSCFACDKFLLLTVSWLSFFADSKGVRVTKNKKKSRGRKEQARNSSSNNEAGNYNKVGISCTLGSFLFLSIILYARMRLSEECVACSYLLFVLIWSLLVLRNLIALHLAAWMVTPVMGLLQVEIPSCKTRHLQCFHLSSTWMTLILMMS